MLVSDWVTGECTIHVSQLTLAKNFDAIYFLIVPQIGKSRPSGSLDDAGYGGDALGSLWSTQGPAGDPVHVPGKGGGREDALGSLWSTQGPAGDPVHVPGKEGGRGNAMGSSHRRSAAWHQLYMVWLYSSPFDVCLYPQDYLTAGQVKRLHAVGANATLFNAKTQVGT